MNMLMKYCNFMMTGVLCTLIYTSQVMAATHNHIYARSWVWAGQENAPLNIPYDPSPWYEKNTGYEVTTTAPFENYFGGQVKVTRVGTGRYVVDFLDLQRVGYSGHVQVSAYGGSHYCKVVSWYPTSNAIKVRDIQSGISGLNTLAVNGSSNRIWKWRWVLQYRSLDNQFCLWKRKHYG